MKTVRIENADINHDQKIKVEIWEKAESHGTGDILLYEHILNNPIDIVTLIVTNTRYLKVKCC